MFSFLREIIILSIVVKMYTNPYSIGSLKKKNSFIRKLLQFMIITLSKVPFPKMQPNTKIYTSYPSEACERKERITAA